MSASLRGNHCWENFQQENYWAMGISKDRFKPALETNLNIPNDGPNLVNSIPSEILPLLLGVDRCIKTPVFHGIVLETGSSIDLEKTTLKQSTTEVEPSAITLEDYTSSTATSSGDSAATDCNIDKGTYPVHVTDTSNVMHEERVDSLHYSLPLNTQNADVRDASVVQMVEQEFTRSCYQGIQTTVPTARCVLNNQSLKLSEPVIAELKTLQAKLLEHGDDENATLGLCLNYFQKYGTYVNLGEVHFGGKYKWEGRYKGVERHSQTIKKMVGSYLAEYILNPNRVITQSEYVKCQTSQEGGPQDPPSFEAWKIDLLANSKSWVVIHRSINYTGIWDILPNHRDVLQDVTQLCNTLKKAWTHIDSNTNPTTQQSNQDTSKRDQTNTDIDKRQQALTDINQPQQTLQDIGQTQQTGQKQQMYTATGLTEQANMDKGQTQQSDPNIGMKSMPKSNIATKSKPHCNHLDNRKYLLKHMELVMYFPEKIAASEVMTAGDNVPKDRSPMANVAWDVFKKLIMLDHRAITSEIDRCMKSEGDIDQAPETVTGGFADFDEITQNCEEFHPLDIFLTIFSCCELNLKQILLQKMNICHLAVPFIYPGFDTESLTCSMWALRTTILRWRDESQKAREASAVNCSSHVVSCIRLKRPSFSKAKMLNDVISDQIHQTFFNVDCPNGMTKKVVSDGLVEASFFLPNGNEKQGLKAPTTFLNLRGDGTNHDKQVEVLCQMSNAIVICLDINDLNDPNIIATMKNIHNQIQKIIFVFSNGRDLSNKFIRQQLQEYSSCIEDEHLAQITKVFAFTASKNAAKLKTEMMEAISNILLGQEGYVLANASQMMYQKGLNIDEMNKACQEGKALAENVMACVHQNSMKDILLPLQGKHWRECCKLLKKKKRTRLVSNEESPIYQVGIIEQEMKEHRDQQVKVCDNLNSFTSQFIDGLSQSVDTPILGYYLKWLKMYLDDMSRKVLPSLQEEYQENMTAYKAAKKASNTMSVLSQIREIEEKIDNAAFGMEHLMREVGQVYEAVMSSDNSDRKLRFKTLPSIVAKLLLKGQSLEIMDGDTSGVPMTWLQAVLSEVEILAGNIRLFCLSVIGVQSSGKSTLLNSMFGLEFPVSAGRCTRGVYMQLVKVTKDSTLPFDYVVVIDSEGLRASEIGESTPDHDNELATFVISLGNVTIINIKGENVAEVKDILQVVSHAFLRMMMANKSIQKERSCVVIHQNVAAVNSQQKMQRGAQQLQESLDKNTVEAAALENFAHINSFNQIIKFDSKKNVWHFPDLWCGDPPMALVNIGYHQKVTSLKSYILTELAKQSMSISDMNISIGDIWDAVLADDFVFCFRNSLVTRTYNQLEERFSQIRWELRVYLSEWLDQINWKDCTHEGRSALKEKAVSAIRTKQKEALIMLAHFVQNNPHKAIMHQYTKDKEYALQCAGDSLCLTAAKEIDEKIAKAEVNIMKTRTQDKQKEQILQKAETLAQEMKGQAQDDSVLKQVFETMWSEWICEISLRDNEEAKPTDGLLKNLLFESFDSNTELVETWTSKTPIDKTPDTDCLKGSFENVDIENELSFSHSLVPNQLGLRVNLTMEALQLLDGIFEKIDSYHSKLCKRNDKFQVHDAREVIRMTQIGLEKLNNLPEKQFSIPTGCEVKVVVHVCRYALRVFKNVQSEYDKKHSVMAKLRALKQVIETHFKNVVRQKKNEIIIVDMVCGQLEQLIGKTVKKAIQRAVVVEIVPQFITKSKLIKAMLRDLAEKECYVDCQAYIFNSKHFALHWLTQYTNEYIFSERKGSCWYADCCKKYIEAIIMVIYKAIAKACDSVAGQHSTAAWMKTFINEASSCLSFTQFKQIEQYDIENYNDLRKRFADGINKVRENVNAIHWQHNAQTISWTSNTPYQKILDALWGCESNCPFCEEPCKRSDPDHTSTTVCHKCIQHRPKGISKWHFKQNEKLVVENCNYYVHSNEKFWCSGNVCKLGHTDEILHLYKDYQELLPPTWHIGPNPDMTSSDYWKWYLNRFQHEIIEGTKFKLPDIPPSWADITKKEAIASLSLYD